MTKHEKFKLALKIANKSSKWGTFMPGKYVSHSEAIDRHTGEGIAIRIKKKLHKSGLGQEVKFC